MIALKRGASKIKRREKVPFGEIAEAKGD